MVFASSMPLVIHYTLLSLYVIHCRIMHYILYTMDNTINYALLTGRPGGSVGNLETF